MRLPHFSIDTHAQYWQIVQPKLLSAGARSIFAEAQAGKVVLILSHVVIAELFYLFRKQGQAGEFAPFLARTRATPACRIEGIITDDLARLPDFTEIPEMHDRPIAIQAQRLDATIVTKDASIHACPQVRCVW